MLSACTCREPVYFQEMTEDTEVLTPEHGQEVLIKVNGEVTFTRAGLDNVHQVHPNWDPFSGDSVEASIPAVGSNWWHVYTHVRRTGEYYFLQVHQSMRIKIRVIDCTSARHLWLLGPRRERLPLSAARHRATTPCRL